MVLSLLWIHVVLGDKRNSVWDRKQTNSREVENLLLRKFMLAVAIILAELSAFNFSFNVPWEFGIGFFVALVDNVVSSRVESVSSQRMIDAEGGDDSFEVFSILLMESIYAVEKMNL